MSTTGQISIGMPVYGFDTLPIGPVEGLDGEGIQVHGHQITVAAIARVTGDAVYLKVAGGALLARHDEQPEPADALLHGDGTTLAAPPDGEHPDTRTRKSDPGESEVDEGH